METVFDTIGQEWTVVDNKGDKVTHLVFKSEEEAQGWILHTKDGYNDIDIDPNLIY